MIELPWDAEVESPATIAIIGGGPMGIEAAIYARFLGYFASIFEQRRVAHRMLDWHDRPLAVPVAECTTSLGWAAIEAQNPDSKRVPSEEIFTGKRYAEEYLLPLAKTDLLFDDIHFLSPVASVSRIQTQLGDAVEWQERCNDEFRILVEGRHRGPWVARADVVLDCRGATQVSSGMGPGGGLAIGEIGLRDSFLLHAPKDRKFELKSIAGKHVCVVGQSIKAVQFATEWTEQFANRTDMRLTWAIRSERRFDSDAMAMIVEKIRADQPSNVVLLESLGLEQIRREDSGEYVLRFLREDDSTVDLGCDAVAALTDRRSVPLSSELHLGTIAEEEWSFISNEPGLYVLRGGDIESGAGVGLKQGFEAIRKVFALIAGREDLDLYQIMEKQRTVTNQK